VEEDPPLVHLRIDAAACSLLDTGDMTTTDDVINALFIGLVVVQVRGRRLTTFGLLVPLAVMAWVVIDYLHGIPTSGNNLVLATAGAALGLALGVACGMSTAVYRDESGDPFAKAGLVAGVLWVLGTGARLAFTLYASHGGQDAIGLQRGASHHLRRGLGRLLDLDGRRRGHRPHRGAGRAPPGRGGRPALARCDGAPLVGPSRHDGCR